MSCCVLGQNAVFCCQNVVVFGQNVVVLGQNSVILGQFALIIFDQCTKVSGQFEIQEI